ncbi:MAG: 50S ribosomal protein L16 [Candidatus Woesearchaeota archaeon]
MAKLRKACAYRRIERPHTRISKFRKKSFVRARPASKVVRYDMGDPVKSFKYTLNLVSKQSFQLRHNAIESGRQSANKLLEKNLGKSGYYLKIRVYPHHILRENPLASGAGADRMSTGMARAFGKPIGIAAQIKRGQPVVLIRVDEQNIRVARDALKKFSYKFPGSYSIQMVQSEA